MRGFTQDDAHIFCRPDQIEAEVGKVLDFTLFVLRRFGFSRDQTWALTLDRRDVW